MAIPLDENGLDIRRRNLGTEAWYYEELIGLRIYLDGREIGIIRWRSLKAALDRKEKGRRKKQIIARPEKKT